MVDYRFVLLAPMDENWGWLSDRVFSADGEPRTATNFEQWGNMLRDGCGSTPADVLRFLDDPRLALLLETQHRAVAHPRLRTLPIGVKPAKVRDSGRSTLSHRGQGERLGSLTGQAGQGECATGVCRASQHTLTPIRPGSAAAAPHAPPPRARARAANGGRREGGAQTHAPAADQQQRGRAPGQGE